MGLLDRFEQGVENVVNGTFAKVFRSELRPVEIASAIRSAMDDRAAALTPERTVAPNEFLIRISATDYDKIEQWGEDALIAELIDNAMSHATSQGYSFVGPLHVTFEESETVGTGRLKVEATTVRGNVAPATHQTGTQQPVISINGQNFLLTGEKTVIGRGVDSDIVVEDSGVSRHHLSLEITPDGVIARDMGSTNGLYVEGHKVEAATLQDGNTLTIGRTQIMFWEGTQEDYQ